MKPLAIIAASIVTLALLSYTLGIVREQRKRKVGRGVLFFLTLGVGLDITATILMIIVSTNSPFTLHGLMGYSALLLMLTDASLLWRHHLLRGADESVPRPLHRYSLTAYLLWVSAYITGSLMVMI